MSAPAETLTIPASRAEKRNALDEAAAMIPQDLVPMNSPMATILNPVLYKHLMTVAAQFSQTQLIPKHFQNHPEDCFVALHMAHRLGADPIMVLQNLYVVHGTPGWSAKFIIAQANMSRVFSTRIKFRHEGDELMDVSKSTLKVTAYATMNDGSGDVVEATASMDMARAEGWSNNPKYKGLQRQMLSYRAATLLVRLYAPEVLMGVPVVDELEDIDAAAGVSSATVTDMRTYDAASLNDMLKPKAPAVTEDPAPTAAPSVDLTIHDDAAGPAAPAAEAAPEQAPVAEAASAGPKSEPPTYDGPTYPQLLTMIDKAKTAEDLDEVRDLARALPDPALRTTVGQKARARLKALQGDQQ